MRSKKAIYNIISNLVLQLVVVVYGFIIPKIIITNFGSSVNGLITSITQFLGYISLLESGFGPVVKSILYNPIAKKDKKEISNILNATEKFFKKISYVFVIYILVLAVLYPLVINNEFEYIFTLTLIIIISISTFAEYFFGMTYKVYLNANQEHYIISIIQIITYILNIIAIVILVKLNTSIHIIKLFSALIFILRPISQNLYVRKKYGIDLKTADNNYKITNKWDGLAQHIASVIHGSTDVALLTIFCTLSEVSVYSIYYLVVSGIKKIIQAFTNGIEATFGDMIAKQENENLNRRFNMYEVLYFSITTIVFSTTLMLISPFVSIYTKEIHDANYVRYIFGYLIVISEYICMIRLPYISVSYAAGRFKETRKGAWIEALTNILISIIFVKKYGIVGVTVGTIIAMTIRTIEFICYANKNILKRTIKISIKKVIILIVETLIIVVISSSIHLIAYSTYINWIINALIIMAISIVVTITINAVFYTKEYKDFLAIIKQFISRRSKKNENRKIC